MENFTPFDLGGLAKDRSPFGPAEDRPLHEASYVGMKHAFEALGGKYKVDRHGSHRLFLLGISSQGFDYYTED